MLRDTLLLLLGLLLKIPEYGYYSKLQPRVNVPTLSDPEGLDRRLSLEGLKRC